MEDRLLPGKTPMPDLGLIKERAKCRKLLREHIALYAFLHLSTKDYRKRIDTALLNLDSASKTLLRRQINLLENEISQLRSKYKVVAPTSTLLELLDAAELRPQGYITLPKYRVRDFAKDFHKIVPRFGSLPEHARVGFHSGHVRQNPGELEIFILEAKIYEDMCCLFNLAAEARDKLALASGIRSKMEIKACEALRRGTVTNAFYFIEAYLNGMAFDYLVTHQDSIDNKTYQILSEWDTTKNCQRYLSMHEKALQFPRIVLGEKHSPLQETNCPELRYLLSKVKLLRDAIAHPSPVRHPTMDTEKEQRVFEVSHEEVEKIVDSSISYVQQLDKLIHGDSTQVDWLHPRNTNGIFPAAAFD